MARRGRGARNKGANYERKIAEKFKERYDIELRRTPQSGGFAYDSKRADEFRGDILPVESNVDMKLHIECKNQKTWQLRSWLEQAESDCPEGKIPMVVMHKPNTSKEYVVLDLEDFFKLVDKNKIFNIKGVTKKTLIKKIKR